MTVESKPRKSSGRVDILDGLRAFAILLVVGFHFYVRWTPPLHDQNFYPYGGLLKDFPVFSPLGVELFFIVSGFVISMTLFSSTGPLDFALKRFARLFPTMLLCAALTYLVVSVSPSHLFQVHPGDVVASLTFVDPQFLHHVFGGEFGSVDGVYWSLYVEVKFYLWACFLFFVFGSARFIRAFAILFAISMGLHFVSNWLPGSRFAEAVELALFPSYMMWFAAGVGFYYLYVDEQTGFAAGLVLASLVARVFGLAYAAQSQAAEWTFTFLFYGLFTAFVYRPSWMVLFAARPVVAVGAASYSLYLLHQRIGVSLVSDLAQALGLSGAPQSVALGVLVASVCVAASIVIHRQWEMPSKRWVLRVLSRPRFVPRQLAVDRNVKSD